MKVTFQIEGATPVIMECNAGDNLLELARRGNVAIDAPCSGNGSCGKCRVKLVEGELESLRSRHITDEEWELGWRLSCNSKILSDCTVFVLMSSSPLKTSPSRSFAANFMVRIVPSPFTFMVSGP